jgi:hypothetical protein
VQVDHFKIQRTKPVDDNALQILLSDLGESGASRFGYLTEKRPKCGIDWNRIFEETGKPFDCYAELFSPSSPRLQIAIDEEAAVYAQLQASCVLLEPSSVVAQSQSCFWTFDTQELQYLRKGASAHESALLNQRVIKKWSEHSAARVLIF